ncbi:MAG: ATP-binding protein [bacterium]|nr:ATP-binding protein [bacterium]
MARVLRGEYESIRLEPPGPEGQGVEFWLRRRNSREYFQVKRQGARRGRWTLQELNDLGVLTAFQRHLADVSTKCVFVSMQDADELRELAERARGAADLPEFECEFAKGEWGVRFAKLGGFWSECTRAEVFSHLKRIQVRTIDEETLRRYAELELTALVEGDASTASDVLFAYALQSVHQELDGAQIKNHLSSRGFNRPVWAEPQALADVVEVANERYLTFLNRELIRGELIQRDEATRALAALREGSAKRGVILTGVAGAGKSTVLLQVIKSLQQQSIPALAFRVDRLEPTQRPDEAGRQIGLPASPVKTLAALANGGPCVLVLDQLDAVSLMSGRNTSFFECFDEMVRQALTLPAMRLAIACRRFDFENDHRLRRLGGRDDMLETVEVAPLSEDMVRQTVTAIGLDVGRLAEHQVRLLSVPAHLKLLCEVAQGAATSLNFETANELYGLYWDRKDQLLRARLGPTLAWSSAIDMLCEHMSERQGLSAPVTILDEATAIRDALLSEHVLAQDGPSISFFHEGFFDYAFARRFAARGADLIGLLRSGEQHLFRRAQVRQILLHEREIDQQRYLANLATLLESADIRFHIKQVVFALLTQFADPSEAEWRILETLLHDPGYPHRSEIEYAVLTLPWFKLLDSLGVVASWLGQGDSDVDRAVLLLRRVQRDAPDRVAELVEPYIGKSEEWRNRFRHLLQWADLHSGRRFFDLFLRLIANGDLDGMGRFRADDFLGMFHGLPEERADWTCEAIGQFLDRRLNVALDAGDTNPFKDEGGLRYSQSSDRVLIGTAQSAPSAFIKHVLPFMLRVIELNAIRDGDTPWEDTVWQWRHRDGGHSVDEHLLRAMKEAVGKLARDAPVEFRRIVASLRKSEHETVHFLLTCGYAENGERFADEAIDYLCESPRRLRCGYFDAGFSHRATRDLIEAATPFCSDEQIEKLEAMLLVYFTDWERSADGRQSRGLTQFELLTAIDRARRSALVEARIGEWQRKFNRDAPAEPRLGGVSWVGSPIPANAHEKMTDEQWLGAVARYANDREPEWRDGKPLGGAHQLSQVLESRVRKEPLRFARLVLRFSDGTNPTYFRAALRGLDAGCADTEAIFEACRRCHRLPNRPAGSAFCYLVGKHPMLRWPDDLLDTVAWYATEDPDPNQELWRTEASNGQCYYGGDVRMAGINCVRGAAAGAVRALLFAEAERIPHFLATLRRMVCDPSIAVRSCVVSALLPVLNCDRDLAVELMLELCDTDDVLLKTHDVEEFMRYATPTHFGQLQPIVDRMLHSSDPVVAQTGARQMCLASLGLEEAADLAEQCLVGSEALRKGAAQVFAANVGHAQFRSVCGSGLARLFDDPSEKVRALAAECFDHLEHDALGQITALVERFQGSTAFEANHEPLIQALERTTARLPDVTISVCERFIVISAPPGGDMRTQVAGDADRLSELIIRAYHQTGDQTTNSRCLDTIDNLLCHGAAGLQRVLGELDR